MGSGAEPRYRHMSVKVLRGREAAITAKWQGQGWELVGETRGPLRSELSFRRTKPRGLGTFVAQVFGAFRRLSPRVQVSLLAGAGALVVAAGVGIAVSTVAGGDAPSAAGGARPVATTSTAHTTATGSPRATPLATQSSGPVPAQPERITVDALVEKINSGTAGAAGDRFTLTGELAGSEYWTTGASGDYFVMLKTTSGSDLEVFVDESEAQGWADGMQVQMVVENVEITINDETTDGLFRAVSTKVL